MATTDRPMAKRPKRRRVVALTGARTFIGRNLVGVLEEDDSVGRIVVIDTERPDTGAGKTRVYNVDLTALRADERLAEILQAEGVDSLLHLAFSSSPDHAPAWAHELEAAGTMHLLNAARQARPSQLLLGSQTWLYGADPGNPAFLRESAPLSAPSADPFFADKIAAEREFERFADEHPDAIVTVLRCAPIVGPTVRNFMTRYLSQRLMVTLMGFDPMWQFIHEVDAVAAFKVALDRATAGTFNIVGDGLLPLSKVVRLTGQAPFPVLLPLARMAVTTMWAGQIGPWPPSFLPYLRYVSVADGERAAERLGFLPAYTTEEALLDFVSAQRLRQVRLASEVRP
jgi:UDP-glucose 4-epimerase